MIGALGLNAFMYAGGEQLPGFEEPSADGDREALDVYCSVVDR